MMPIGFSLSIAPLGFEVSTFRTPKCLNDRLLDCHQEAGFTVAVLGTLIPRPGEPRRTAVVTASALASAYKTHGHRCFERLRGDYCFVLVDHGHGHVYVSRDPMGGYPLFWGRRLDQVVIATSLRILTDLIGWADVNWESFADVCTMPNAGHAEPQTERTAFVGCQRVLPGQVLRFRPEALEPEFISAWSWGDFVASRGGSADRESAVQEVQAAIADALERRMNGTVGCHFSGGMDSTGLAALSAKIAQGRGERVHGIAKVYPGFRHLSREREYIDAAASRLENLRLHLLDETSPEAGPDGPAEAPLLDEPSGGRLYLGSAARLLQSLRQEGVITVFSGHGGDHLFDCSPGCQVGSLFRRGQVRTALDYAKRFARQCDRSRGSVMVHAFQEMIPHPLRSGIRPWINGGFADWMHLSDQTVPPWVERTFACRLNMFSLAVGKMLGRRRLLEDSANNFSLTSVIQQSGDLSRWYVASGAGIALANPFFDVDLVRSVLSLPSEVRLQPGRQKALLGDALRGLLPDQIIDRRVKGHFGEVTDSMTSSKVESMQDLITRAEIPAGVLSKGALSDCLAMAARGIYKDVAGLDRLLLTLAFLEWLEALPQWRSQPYTRESRGGGRWGVQAAASWAPSLTLSSRERSNPEGIRLHPALQP